MATPKPLNILVVDDVPIARDALDGRVAKQGHSVAKAADEFEALDALATGSFDRFLLDLVMPNMDGYQVLEHLKAEGDIRLGGKSKIVSIRISDSRNFTHQLKNLGPTDTVDRLNNYIPKWSMSFSAIRAFWIAPPFCPV